METTHQGKEIGQIFTMSARLDVESPPKQERWTNHIC